MRPPTDENAWVQPRTFSRRRGSGKSSASQATAATNSTETPTKVVQRKNRNIWGDVEKALASAENA